MIHGIQILFNPEDNWRLRAQLTREALLIDAHRRGEHPHGSMRRDCPLCQLNK